MGSRNLIGVIGFSVFILLFPLVQNIYLISHYVDIMVFVGITAMITMGLAMLMGHAGQISLGHAAFYGIGAYTSGLLTAKFGFNPWLAVVLGVGLSGSVAVLVGSPSLKLRGHYLAMATLAFGEIIFIVFNTDVEELLIFANRVATPLGLGFDYSHLVPLTEGPDGFGSIPQLSIFGFAFDSVLSYYYLVWAVAIAMLVFNLNLIHSRIGRALNSIHGSEVAARAMGVNAAKYKIQVFILSAVMASIAGSLYAHYVLYVNPSGFNLFASIKLVMMVVIGGMASVWGAILGAALLTFLPEWLLWLEDFDVLVNGAILLVIVMFLPKGLASLPGKLFRLFRRTPRSKS